MKVYFTDQKKCFIERFRKSFTLKCLIEKFNSDFYFLEAFHLNFSMLESLGMEQ